MNPPNIINTSDNHHASLSALLVIIIAPGVTYGISYLFGVTSIVFIYWIVTLLFLITVLDIVYWGGIDAFIRLIYHYAKIIARYYRIHEYNSIEKDTLPNPPTDIEKYSYITRNNTIILICSIVSFSAIQVSMFNFLLTNELLWPLFFYFVLTIIYFSVSFLINISSKDFNLKLHKKVIKKWKPALTDTVDIFLPTAGESLEVLRNTWDGIREVKRLYKGNITVYCLDDADREEVKRLATIYGFIYEVRSNRGWFKKAGNLRHGFTISKSTFIVIFDADFRPREDILQEMLPYFYENNKIGLVQSPQYFDVSSTQNWLQRGAGAVQELFYRVSQVSRQNHDASICVGSNAIYRRAALADSGGTALIEHSEDVHTGFNMRMHGWTIQYLPIVLAKGLCPGDMKAFFKQQYRWCLGSMTLLSSQKFWQSKISIHARLSYFSGFLYYIHTAVSSFFVPIIPLAILILYPEQVTLQNYMLILPSIFFVQVIYPFWHRATYGIEAWSTRSVYGWAHIFAIVDGLTQKKMQWQPTGTKGGKDLRYIQFRILQVIFNFIPSIVWIYLSAEQVFLNGNTIFIPILLSGVYYYLISAKVTFYMLTPAYVTHMKKTNYLWRTFPTTSFSLISIVIIEVMTASLYVKSIPVDYVSPIALNVNDVKSQQIADVKGSSDTLIIIESGSYVEIADQGDTYSKLIQRMLNTYSAESGDVLTLHERNIIESRILIHISANPLQLGDSINVTRKEMRTHVQESRKEKLL